MKWRSIVWRRSDGLLAVLGAVTALQWWATAVWALLPFGSAIFIRWSWLWSGAFILACLMLPVSLLAALASKIRPKALRVAAGCAAIIVGFGVGGTVGRWHRTGRLETIPTRAAPLIAAIGEFERDHRRPPESLEELVDGYIATIPSTGFSGHPTWGYDVRPFENGPGKSDLYGDNPWALNFYAGGWPASDRLVYLPNLRYPSRAARIAEWVRVGF